MALKQHLLKKDGVWSISEFSWPQWKSCIQLPNHNALGWCLVIDLHVVSLRSLSHWKTMQLLPVKTWVIQLSQPDPSAWMKGMEILTSPWCILILAIVQPTEIMTSFTIGPTCAYYSSPFSSWNLVRCSSRPFEGKPTRQTPCPIRPQCYTALCGQSVPENPGAFSFWIFWGDWKGKNAAWWLVWIGDLFRGTSRGDSSRGIGFNWTFEQQKPFEKVFVSLILREKCEK